MSDIESDEEDTSQIAPYEPMPHPKIFISHTLSTLVNSRRLSDVTFLVGPQREPVYAHRTVLAARSRVFKAMFFANWAERTLSDIEIPDVSPASMVHALQCVYTDRCRIRPENAQELLFVAKKYQLEKLYKKCLKFLKTRCGVKSACTLLNTMEEELVLNFIEDNAEACIKSAGWKELSEKNLLALVQSEQLACKEASLFVGVLDWADAECTRQNLTPSPPNRKKVLSKVTPHIRFPIMELSDFARLVPASQLLDTKEVLSILRFLGKIKEIEKPPEAQDYSCTACTFLNTGDRPTCEMCGSPAPPPSIVKPVVFVDWECLACTYQNTAKSSKCEICLSDRPASACVEVDYIKPEHDFIYSVERRVPRTLNVSKLKFLLVAADGAPNLQDAQSSIVQAYGKAGYGPVSSEFKCDVVPVTAGGVTLQQLQRYDALLVWSGTHQFPDGFGNILADYVDQGGGVVIACMATNTDAFGLTGRFDREGYSPTTRGTPARAEAPTVTINKKHPARKHPLFRKVALFEGGANSGRNNLQVNGNARVISAWDDGVMFAAEKKAPIPKGQNRSSTVVTLNFYPVSSAVEGRNWNRASDGGLILLNALAHACQKEPAASKPKLAKT